MAGTTEERVSVLEANYTSLHASVTDYRADLAGELAALRTEFRDVIVKLAGRPPVWATFAMAFLSSSCVGAVVALVSR